MVVIEKRRYDESATEKERITLRKRISLRDEAVIFWHEVPLPNRFVLGLFTEEIKKYSASLDEFFLLINLLDAEQPDADARKGLQELFSAIDKPRYTAAFSGRNILLNSAARFVLRRCGLRDFSVHRTEEEAVNAIRRAAGK